MRYLLLDQHGSPHPHPPLDAIEDALLKARTIPERVCVVKENDDGTLIPMAYSGPDGWKGPMSKRAAS